MADIVRLMVEALPLRIFIASPGDVADERAAILACVEEHRARREGISNVSYEAIGWDRVRGTARRAQEAINELIAESHFMIVLFKSSWGSEPGSPWGYTSGTEEELFTGLLELGLADQPMRDVWVGFVNGPETNDRIIQLRDQIVDRHAVMFESIADLRDLKDKLTDRLESWEELADTKVPRHVDLLPSSGKDVLRAANLRLRGEKLVALGQPDAGRAALKEASILGGPVEHLAYARFLRRSGDLGRALVETQKAIDYLVDDGTANSLYSTLAADAFSAQARVLSAQGRDNDAIGRLEHALTLVLADDLNANVVRCRILDALGLACMRVRDLPGARQRFESALQLRREFLRDIDVCQSLVNLARLEMADGELDNAAGHAEEALGILRGSAPTGLHANAEVLLAQVRLRQERPEDGIRHTQRAVAINRQIANRNGEAISLFVLAQCYQAADRHGEAEDNAHACLALNLDLGDETGAEKASTLLTSIQVR
jgi:tetratricopeptide (TPR) repeat protein